MGVMGSHKNSHGPYPAIWSDMEPEKVIGSQRDQLGDKGSQMEPYAANMSYRKPKGSREIHKES